MKPFYGIGILTLILCTLPSYAKTCHGHFINPIQDISWRCLFPITLGAHTSVQGDLPDTPNSHKLLCTCPGHPFPKVGIALGYWEPMALVDVSRTPYCFVNLGGMHLNFEQKAKGAIETQTPDQGGSFYFVHVYHFPVLQWISSPLLGGSCQSKGNFELVYLSELDPTWRDENLARIVFPETQAFLNPAVAFSAQTACLLDSVIANTGLPSDKAFWCAGSQGFMYPLTGKVVEHIGSLQATTLILERTLFKLHRLGQIKDTDCHQLCAEQQLSIMPKSRYRYQLVYPHVARCQPFGRTTSLWGSFVLRPFDSDDMSYLIWRKRNCCHNLS